jgi:Family of unknown function (DUF5683)
MSVTKGLLILFLTALVGLNANQASAQSVLYLSQQAYYVEPQIQLPITAKASGSNPKRATIMSAIIPGLGQIYNEKYWKVGVIYVAGFAMGYGMKYNVDSLKQFQKALDSRVDVDTSTLDLWYPQLTDAKVTDERDYYRRNRDMLILGFIGLYALQIIDANVDAHLKEFEINKDLSLKISPDFGISSKSRLRTGLSIHLKF